MPMNSNELLPPLFLKGGSYRIVLQAKEYQSPLKRWFQCTAAAQLTTDGGLYALFGDGKTASGWMWGVPDNSVLLPLTQRLHRLFIVGPHNENEDTSIYTQCWYAPVGPPWKWEALLVAWVDYHSQGTIAQKEAQTLVKACHHQWEPLWHEVDKLMLLAPQDRSQVRWYHDHHHTTAVLQALYTAKGALNSILTDWLRNQKNPTTALYILKNHIIQGYTWALGGAAPYWATRVKIGRNDPALWRVLLAIFTEAELDTRLGKKIADVWKELLLKVSLLHS